MDKLVCHFNYVKLLPITVVIGSYCFCLLFLFNVPLY